MLCENCKQKTETRTSQQNKALHKWFTLVADLLNENHFYLQISIGNIAKEKNIEVPWNLTNFKELVWRPAQIAVTAERSSTRIKKGDIDKIFDIINKVIGEQTGLHIPFPCIDQLIERY